MIKIPLTQGAFAIVDDIDANEVLLINWHLSYRPNENKNQTKYARTNIRVDGKLQARFLHNLIGERMGLKGKIDHKNRDSLDCRRENLREATHSQNGMNAPLRKDSTTGVKGVNWSKQLNCYVAHIWISGKKKFLGCFDLLDQAKEARYNAEIKYFGEFSILVNP